jgi:hypothetical protein
MKVLVCGSRNWSDSYPIYERLADLPAETVVIHGCADGADTLAGEAADEFGYWVVEVPCKRLHWKRHGRGAGHRRNAIMLDLAPDLVLAFQRDGSPGTQGTIDGARRRGIPVEVHVPRNESAPASED